MDLNDYSFLIRGAIFSVYNQLGPGLLESAYEKCLEYELTAKGILVDCQVPVPLTFMDVKLNLGYRMDLLVGNEIVVEVKSVDQIHEVHHKQLLTYLKLSGKRLGILVNFNTTDIDKSIFRKINGY